MAIVEELKCSHCGAPISLKPGEIIATCRYCGYTVVIETGKAFTFEHSMLPNKYNPTNRRTC
jgi:DNA-directed RNA polymerase subunit RPC12/RpoP